MAAWPMIRRVPVLAVALGILLAGGAAWAAWTASARPQIRLDPAGVDFGPLAARATRAMAVHNAGRAPLRVLGMSTSCGCTTAAIGASVVPPGGSARLEITFDPAAHGPQAGPARHAVYIRTDDPRTPEVEVEVRAVVLKGSAR